LQMPMPATQQASVHPPAQVSCLSRVQRAWQSSPSEMAMTCTPAKQATLPPNMHSTSCLQAAYTAQAGMMHCQRQAGGSFGLRACPPEYGCVDKAWADTGGNDAPGLLVSVLQLPHVQDVAKLAA
jgi:hypothetical protein